MAKGSSAFVRDLLAPNDRQKTTNFHSKIGSNFNINDFDSWIQSNT